MNSATKYAIQMFHPRKKIGTLKVFFIFQRLHTAPYALLKQSVDHQASLCNPSLSTLILCTTFSNLVVCSLRQPM